MVGLAIGQSPTEPIRQRLEASSIRYSQASPVRRTAGAAGFVRVDSHYEPPASEAGACKPVQRATQWSSARYGTGLFSQRLSGPLRAPVARDRLFRQQGCSASGCPPASLPPSHIPSDGLLVGCTPARLRGPLFLFRKIHLYGKTKKSTHGHQTTKPSCTHSGAEPVPDPARRGESNATGPAAVGGVVQGRLILAYPVATLYLPYTYPRPRPHPGRVRGAPSAAWPVRQRELNHACPSEQREEPGKARSSC